MNGGPFPEQHETRMNRHLAHKWREMFQRRRRMRDPLLVFNMSIFNFDDGWNRIFTPIQNSRKRHVIKDPSAKVDEAAGRGDAIHAGHSTSPAS
jgi:hypothetical protein